MNSTVTIALQTFKWLCNGKHERRKKTKREKQTTESGWLQMITLRLGNKKCSENFISQPFDRNYLSISFFLLLFGQVEVRKAGTTTNVYMFRKDKRCDSKLSTVNR